MIVKNHWLQAESVNEKIIISKSGNARTPIDPDYLVLHYTATDTAKSAVDWFMNTSNNPDFIAAHIVVDVDGTITQLVPFNLRANHSGTSTWDGVEGLNYHSIGIEIVNPGFVEKLSDGSFRRRVTNTQFKAYPASESRRIIKAKHKHKFWTAKDNQHWFSFPKAQLQAVYALSKVLIDAYQLVNVIGHDDISPARKPDPGPAFPWDEFRQQVQGFENNTGKIYKVNTAGTNFRAAASTNAASIKKLAAGYEVGLIETNGNWAKVYLCDKVAEVMQSGRSVKTIGWIHRSLLTPKPL